MLHVHDKSKKNQKECIIHYYVNLCETLGPDRWVDRLLKEAVVEFYRKIIRTICLSISMAASLSILSMHISFFLTFLLNRYTVNWGMGPTAYIDYGIQMICSSYEFSRCCINIAAVTHLKKINYIKFNNSHHQVETYFYFTVCMNGVRARSQENSALLITG